MLENFSGINVMASLYFPVPSKLPIKSLSLGASKGNENDCPICYESLKRDEYILTTGGCKQSYHFNCLKTWSTENRSLDSKEKVITTIFCNLFRCPTCQSSLDDRLFHFVNSKEEKEGAYTIAPSFIRDLTVALSLVQSIQESDSNAFVQNLNASEYDQENFPLTNFYPFRYAAITKGPSSLAAMNLLYSKGMYHLELPKGVGHGCKTTPLYESIANKNKEAAKYLLSVGANPNGNDYRRPAVAAAAYAKLELLKQLYDREANLGLSQEDGKNILSAFFFTYSQLPKNSRLTKLYKERESEFTQLCVKTRNLNFLEVTKDPSDPNKTTTPLNLAFRCASRKALDDMYYSINTINAMHDLHKLQIARSMSCRDFIFDAFLSDERQNFIKGLTNRRIRPYSQFVYDGVDTFVTFAVKTILSPDKGQTDAVKKEYVERLQTYLEIFPQDACFSQLNNGDAPLEIVAKMGSENNFAKDIVKMLLQAQVMSNALDREGNSS